MRITLTRGLCLGNKNVVHSTRGVSSKTAVVVVVVKASHKIYEVDKKTSSLCLAQYSLYFSSIPIIFKFTIHIFQILNTFYLRFVIFSLPRDKSKHIGAF